MTVIMLPWLGKTVPCVAVAAVCWRVWWLGESNSSVDGASDGSLSRCKVKRERQKRLRTA
jgi:hypothetical protein